LTNRCLLLSSLFSAVVGIGCGQALDVPLPFQTPPLPIDVDVAVTQSTDAACADPTAESCQGIAGVCAIEAGAPCNPVTLPAEIPAEVDGESVEEVLGDDLRAAFHPNLSIYAEPGKELPDNVDTDRISAVTIESLGIVVTNNTLTFDLPVMDVYVGDSETGDDVAGRVASGALKKVGVIGQSTDDDTDFEVGIIAGEDADIPLTFVEGGNDILNEAFRSLAFEFVMYVPDDAPIALKAAADPAKRLSPAGKVDMSLKAQLNYRVSASDLGIR
jgi:hypothetical protein